MGGNSKSLLAYADVQEAFDRAIASPKGVLLRFGTSQARDSFMFRAFSFRSLDRKNNKVIYVEPAHSMHGRSIYDTLSLLRDGDTKLQIKRIAAEYEIEDLE